MSEEDMPLIKKEILSDFNELNQETNGVKKEISSDYEEWNKETPLDDKDSKNEISLAPDGLIKNALTSFKESIKDEPTANQCEKKKKLFVTSEQRECIIRFMIENPELITHSSTQNSELKLWKELITELNALKPEKEFKCWRDYWRRWLRAIETNTKIKLTPTDSKLHQYLNQIRRIEKKTKRKITAKEINDQLNKIEEKKMQLNFELDELNYTVLIYKSTLEDTEKKIIELNKTKAQLTIAKRYLHYRKRLIEEENINACDAQLNVIKKENSCIDQTK